MCGIAGIIQREGSVDPAQLQRMAGTLTHRGPEDSGVHVDGPFGIAHTRLSIIDLAGGHQPLFDADRRHALVCNGEIYNYVELRAELVALGAQPLTHSDSEAALHAYAQWGLDGFKRLNGMFAFALHDRQARKVWLVRDRLGIKPLYVARLADCVLFASELKALLALMPRRIHARALAQFLQSQCSTGEQTILEGVTRVAPGTALCIGPDLAVETHTYWRATDVNPRAMSEAEALEAWAPLFEQVMREHMRSDVPFGVFLSGGVDSAILLAELTRLQQRPVHTYSIGWRGARLADEVEDAERMAQQFGSHHMTIRMDADAVFRRLPRSVWAADDLMRDYACLPTLALAEYAARSLKVVFSGEGGDEAFAGYGRYRPGAIEHAYKAWRYPRSGGFRARGDLHPGWVRRLFVPELQGELQAFRAPLEQAWQQTPASWSNLQRRQYADLTTHLPDDLLVKTDRMLMSVSVEGRVPFLDHRVVEFGLALPDALKVSGRGGKVLLRKWAQGFLPADPLGKRKRGFHVPVNEWLSAAFVARLAGPLLRSPAIRQWCRPQAVAALLRRQQARGDVTREVWSLMMLAIWHRIFIEGAGTPGSDEDPLAWM